MQRRRVTKSVFAAGTAKRTAEMLRRKSPLEDQVDQDRPRKTGINLPSFTSLNAFFHD